MYRTLIVAALVALASALAVAQTDVSGTWTITMDAGQGANDAPLVLEQDGDTLTGMFGDADAGAPVEGTVSGSEISMTTEIDAPQVGAMTLTFTGTIEGDGMKGSVDFGGFMQGTWSAAKN